MLEKKKLKNTLKTQFSIKPMLEKEIERKKSTKKNMSQLGLTRHTRVSGYKIEITS
jgi:hypothetical protein